MNAPASVSVPSPGPSEWQVESFAAPEWHFEFTELVLTEAEVAWMMAPFW